MTGLSSSTTYGFALCAVNSDQSQKSASVTFTEATQDSSSGPVSNLGTKQVLFSTSGTYQGNFGGLYFGDFICQNEANSQSLGGIWKAVMADGTTAATSHILIPGSVYNNRPVSAGGSQLVSANAAAFWGSSFGYANNYNAAGTSPGSGNTWTGSTAAGLINAGLSCTNWTTNLNTSLAETGSDGNAGNGIATSAANNCSNYYSLYCTNQQTSSATPPTPTSFTWFEATSNSIILTFASGGGTTAGYQLAYQAGSAPANCTTGSVVTPTTLGVNPVSYTVTGLASSTTYGFTLCAVNSDQSQLSTGTSITQATVSSSSSPLVNLATDEVVFETSGTYQGNFGGLYFGDFICQNEATNAGLTGTWKFVASDATTAASSRISIPGIVYNNRPTSSGGIQQVAVNASQFWNSQMAYSLQYNASGTSPGSAVAWTGSLATGAIDTNLNCSNWTSNTATVSAEYGNNTSNNVIANGAQTCNNRYSFYCINQQASAATPPDAATFATYSIGSTSIGFSFSSGGGSTAGYELAYTTGTTAPSANCSSGTLIPATTIGVSPTTYVVSGLSASTTYSFRLCAVNSDVTSVSTGRTITSVTTQSSSSAPVVSYGSTQVIFSTTNITLANFGGLYYGDFLCQQEANNTGLPGVWKAILSDDSNAASSRIALSSGIYNNRSINSGGIQFLSGSAGFWSALFTYPLRYNSAGNVSSSNVPWTGSTGAGGIKTGFTCNSWTTNSAAVNGEYGVSSNTNSTTVFDNASTNCGNNTLDLYCINQQTASAAPPAPTSFAAGTVTTSTVPLTWVSGGGTTAGYQLSYKAGASAPSNCSTGTVVAATTLGVNPTSYTVTGLTSGTQYTFLLCSVNSDLSSMTPVASPVTATTTSLTTPANQTLFSTLGIYHATFGSVYFADFICQNEAINGGLAGTWKAILSDQSTNASSRISLTATNIYNNKAGGAQNATSAANFWGATAHSFLFNYNAAGTAPGSGNTWTGSLGTGALNSGQTCTNWTSDAGTGQDGNDASNTGNGMMVSATPACTNSYSLYCLGSQTSSAAPPDVQGFTAYQVGTTSVGFLWSTGGGTTAAYQLAYQAGSTAPSNCTSATYTIVPAATIGTSNPNSYTVSGLAAGTQYAFRLCASNSDVTNLSTGRTLLVTTQASGNPVSNNFGSTQFIFATTNSYTGNFGGIYFGDYICQTEATSAGLSGIWKAVLSDASTAASSRVSLSSTIYNLRALSSGGTQKVTDGVNFWNGLYYSPVTYTATGLAATNTIEWTGSTAAGAVTASNCSNWTTQLAATSGEYGTSTSTAALATGVTTCNTARGLYCINQQTASATPSEVASFSAYDTNTTAIGFVWASGGGSTAAYQMAYQTGSTAPGSCSAGTIIPAATLGINPTSYTVTGLTSGTTYSFRLCAMSSDLSKSSTGLTVTVTTTSSGSTSSLGTSQFMFASSTLATGQFGGIYFGDRICQSEAATAGLSGVWKAILSDASTAATSHVTLSGNIYNFRPLLSGGAQKVSDSTNFWSNIFFNNPYYTSLGLTPTTTGVWTGSTSTGGIAANTCSSWTSVSNTGTPAGESGRSNGTIIDNGNNTCNSNYTLYCINQQTASAAPPDPGAFYTYATDTSNIGLLWTSGGGTTATYQLAYQTGSYPANCNTGTIVSPSTLGQFPTTYVVTGLASNTTYYFRLCAANSDVSSLSTGLTLMASTTASGQNNPLGGSQNQFMFVTSGLYTGAFGSNYWGDGICQREAVTAGLSGTWKAVLSDSSNAANLRIILTGPVYNLRPLSAGGALKITDNVNFWAGNDYNTEYYTAAGLTPTTNVVWGGSNFAGASSANTCTNWTSDAAGGVGGAGEFGRSNNTTARVDNGNSNCNNSYTLACINQQLSSAAPPDVVGATIVETGTTSISLAWSSGGGSTAGYQIAYSSTGTPASCTSGTVVPPTSMVNNAGSYTLTGLLSGTTYYFLVCAANSDTTSFSPGVAVSGATTSSGNAYPFGTDQFIFATSGLYNGDLGSLYFGDFVCQTEAANAGLSGTWFMVGSDGSTPTSTHISLTGNLYNFRPMNAGGPQKVSDYNNFYNNTMYNQVGYTALGLTPSTSVVWTGSNSTGTASANTCNGWTTVSASVQGEYGRSNNTGATLNNGGSACSNSYTLYCTNQQISAAAPPDPATFSQYLLGPTSVGFSFSSGGGTTAGYQIAYVTGATAPATCNSGTVIPALTIGINPSSYTVTGLASSTQYSFLLCAVNSDQTATSTGVALTGITTESSGSSVTETLGGLQLVFATATTWEGYFGSIYYGDYICQQEANNAGLSGTWFAVLGDDSINPSSHVSLTGNTIFNTRGASAGGIQQISNGTGFWSGPWIYQANYSASGGPPGNVRTWTGALGTGLSNVGKTCSSWTTASNLTNGQIGATTTPNSGTAWTNAACSNFYSLYCINQQTSSATPPDATNLTAADVTSSSVGLIWTPGGGTTAAYQIAYQTGATPPSSCSGGTVISPSTLGYNPTAFTVSGLSASTQYSFLLCAFNSDLTASSAGISVTATTTAAGTNYGFGSNQIIFTSATAYYPNFGGIYFGDYLCQTEANTAGLPGTWRAIIGDSSTAASSHVSIPGNIYNLRPATSGGSQFVSNSSSFFTGDTLSATLNYSSSGGSPGNTYTWAGAAQTGATTANTCSNWTTAATTPIGAVGLSTTNANYVANTTTSCNSTRSLYCINQQVSAATPPDVSSFTNYIQGTTYLGFSWITGGGTTAAYQLAYLPGTTPPASCNTGTIIGPSSMQVNATSYTVSGLTAGTTYAFLLCALNSDQSGMSPGQSLIVTTTSSGVTFAPGTDQFIFTTAANYAANFGTTYWGDYICQNEAKNAGLTGTWKAIIGDNVTAATSRISLSNNIYNMRLPASGGSQQVSNSSTFWTGPLLYGVNYTASGGTPGNTRAWAGMGNGGILSANNCTSWTSNSAAVNGEYATDNSLATNTFENGGAAACNNSYALYCINQQTPAATPPNPTSFAKGTVTTTSIVFTWVSGGGTTAGFQLSYQIGATAPADCNSGTVFSAATLGINPATFTATGLSTGTQYSFRLCAENSDKSQASSGQTLTVTTN